MNTTIQCIIFLACATIYSAAPLMSCRCVKIVKYVNPLLIDDVKEIPPRPYCRKQEVIVTLKNGKSRCLDPTSRSTQQILEAKQKQMAAQTEKMNSISSEAAAQPNTASAAASAPITARPATLSS